MLIVLYPGIFAFDGFQRWAGRAHFLIRDWLPATQSLIVLTSPFDSPTLTRVTLAMVASLSVMALVQIAPDFGERKVVGTLFQLRHSDPLQCGQAPYTKKGLFCSFALAQWP